MIRTLSYKNACLHAGVFIVSLLAATPVIAFSPFLCYTYLDIKSNK